MDPARALGLWRSTFGAVKIEADNSKGGLQTGSVQGIWVYQRQGQEVVGYFAGNLRGNVMQFHWQEPNNPPLTGQGYVVFGADGRQYSGRWWTEHKDRIGDWNGWREAAAQQQYGQDPYAGQQGQPEGAQDPYQPRQDPPMQPYAPQPYAPQPQPRQPQPYAPAPYQQPRPAQPAPYAPYPQQPQQPQQPPPQQQPPNPYY